MPLQAAWNNPPHTKLQASPMPGVINVNPLQYIVQAANELK